jgi:hypothetical protein
MGATPRCVARSPAIEDPANPDGHPDFVVDFSHPLFVSVGFGLGPISDAIRGLEQEPPLVIILHARLSLLLLLFLGVVAGGVRLLRYRIRRINELLAA